VSALEIVVAIVIVIALAGTILPVLPGVVLLAGATLVWAISVGGATAWACFAAIALVLAVGQVVKYLVPGRRLSASGVPSTTLWIGAAGAVVGFFVVPVVGAFAGFPLGIYVAERYRLGGEAAGPATIAALKAVGLSILIEFTAGVLAAGIWVAGVVAT
jgi:uncharacterized protein YqgC (DUF456 family)